MKKALITKQILLPLQYYAFDNEGQRISLQPEDFTWMTHKHNKPKEAHLNVNDIVAYQKIDDSHVQVLCGTKDDREVWVNIPNSTWDNCFQELTGWSKNKYIRNLDNHKRSQIQWQKENIVYGTMIAQLQANKATVWAIDVDAPEQWLQSNNLCRTDRLYEFENQIIVMDKNWNISKEHNNIAKPFPKGVSKYNSDLIVKNMTAKIQKNESKIEVSQNDEKALVQQIIENYQNKEK